MVNIQSLKQLVMAEVGKNRDLTLHDKIIVAVVAYTNYKNSARVNQSATVNMSSLISSSVNNALADLLEKKTNYASYSVLKNYVVRLNKNNLMSFTENELQEIYNKFNLSSLKVQFSTKVFETEMYNVTSIPYHLQQRLSGIHFSIMVPIIQYYHDRFGIPIENMTIYSADEIPSNPGKVITFAIGGIASSTIVNDLRSKLFGIEDMLYSFSLKEELVRLVIY